jgi:hypothetical protein
VDIPDKIIDGSEVRLWRFKADGLEAGEIGITENVPIPIYANDLEWVGAATVIFTGSVVRVLGVCGANVPERLDFDNGVDVYLQPILRLDPELGPEVHGFCFGGSPGPYGILIEPDVL